METFSALLAICAGNSPVPGEFPAQRPVTRSFDVFLDLRLILSCGYNEILGCQNNYVSNDEQGTFPNFVYSYNFTYTILDGLPFLHEHCCGIQIVPW